MKSENPLKDADQAGLERVRPLIKPLSEFRKSHPEFLKPAASMADDRPPIIESLRSAVCTGTELEKLEIKPRAKVLGEFFREADLGFIFSPRGVGKTWLAMAMARAIAKGEACGPWKSSGPQPVLYIDGEMPPEETKQRSIGLQASTEQLCYLNHEILFERTGIVLNLANSEAQEALTALCLEQGVKVLFIDNLSTLFKGMKENDADSWELVQAWLLDLRRKKIAVVIVHHSGRGGKEMRGTSRREDAAFWIVRLEERIDPAQRRSGARFIALFTKQRNAPNEEPPYEFFFSPDSETGLTLLTYKLASTEDVVLEWVRNGLESCEDIASEMGISKGTVSKLARKLIDAGKLKRTGRHYELCGFSDAEG